MNNDIDKNKRKLLATMFLTGMSVICNKALASPLLSLTQWGDNNLYIRKIGTENVEIDGWILTKYDLEPRK